MLSVVVSARVKAISLASVVVIELPPLYADCKVVDAAEHFTKLFEPSRQRVDPVWVSRPVILRYEPAE